MTTVDTRNAAAKSYVLKMLADAKSFKPSKEFLTEYIDEDRTLQALIPIKANGFRGVVLTVIVGMHLDTNYNPTENFYDCNPRSIFEKGIFYALTESNIPCGKSDPLNVAKNAQKIDRAWALGKRPESAALAAAKYISLLWSHKGTPKYEKLVKLFFKRLHDYSIFVAAQNVSYEHVAGEFVGTSVAQKLANFTVECPEGGAMPQFIVGLLLHFLRLDNGKYTAVVGFDESVFGTNTTSKKPADVWEILADGSVGKLYEITVKTIDLKRLDDCVDSLMAQRLADKEVIFICNLPSNVSTIDVKEGLITHKGMQLQFADIKSFVCSGFVLLDANSQSSYIDTLQKFIFSSTRAVATKNYWAANFVNQ